MNHDILSYFCAYICHIAAGCKCNANDDHHQLKCTVNMHFAATLVVTSSTVSQHVKCAVLVAIEPTLVMVMVYCIP